MTVKEMIEICASMMTIAVSITVLWGVFKAHRKGFFKAVHKLAKHYESKIPPSKAKKH